MRTIALARVRLAGAAQNICGISAQTFAVKGGAPGEDQLVGWVDHLTLLDNCILVEREGKPDELLSLSSVASMRPTADLKRDLLGAEEAKQREAEVKKREEDKLALAKAHEARQRAREDQRRKPPPPPVVALRDDDGDVLRPEAAIAYRSQPTSLPVDDEAPVRRGRPRKKF